MLKSILNLEGVKGLTKNEQKLTMGGFYGDNVECPPGYCFTTYGYCLEAVVLFEDVCLD